MAEDVTLVSTNVFECRGVQLSAYTMQIGDQVRLLRSRGNALHGTVVDVTYPHRFTLSNPVMSFREDTNYTLFGIKIFDTERQARIAFARNVAACNPPLTDDTVPRPEFDADLYQLMYPDTRGFSFPDTYIDYRTKWRRNDEYRVIQGGDIFNLSAPYASNLFSAANASGKDLYINGTLYASNVAIGNGLTAGDGFIVSTPTTFNVAGGNVYVTPGATSLCSNLVVTEHDASLRSGISMAASNLVLTESNLSVGGSNFAVLPWGVACAGSNLHVMWGVTTAGDGNVAIASSNVVVHSDLEIASGSVVRVGMSNAAVDPDTRLAVSGDIFATGTLITLSDERTKVEVERIEDATDKVQRLRGCTFRFDPNARRSTGLIAQDVERVLPEAVHDGPSGYKSIAYGNLAGLLVEAIKDLASRVDAIERNSCWSRDGDAVFNRA